MMSLTCKRANSRPRDVTDEMATRAAIKVAEGLLKSGANFDEHDTAEDIADDIVKATRFNRHVDGYNIARDLERLCYWSPDAEMVKVLDTFGWRCRDEMAAALKVWAAENPMERTFPDGVRVTTPHGQGIIHGVSDYTPFSYLVKTDKERKGLLIVAFEDVTAVEAD